MGEAALPGPPPLAIMFIIISEAEAFLKAFLSEPVAV